MTTRGMKETEMAAIADMISEVLLDVANSANAHRVRDGSEPSRRDSPSSGPRAFGLPEPKNAFHSWNPPGP